MKSGSKPSLASALLVALMGCGENCKTYEVDFEELVTDSSGMAQSTDSQTGENRNITVRRYDGSGIEGAIVDYFDANHFELFITSFDDGARDNGLAPMVTLLPGGSGEEDIFVSLTESGYSWEELQQTGSADRRERYEAGHDVVSWAATSPEVWGYQGCRTFGGIQTDFRDIGVFFYDIAKAAIPYVGVISTTSETGREMFDEIVNSGSELPSFYDPSECEAFQTFLFGQDSSGEWANSWTPTFSIMANLCVDIIPLEEIANNSIDDNCNGDIDERSTSIEDDDDDTTLDNCLLCDDFDSFNSNTWPTQDGSPYVNNGHLILDDSWVQSYNIGKSSPDFVLETSFLFNEYFIVEVGYSSSTTITIQQSTDSFRVTCISPNNLGVDGYLGVYEGSPFSAGQERRIRVEYDGNDSLDVQVDGQNIVENNSCLTSVNPTTISVFLWSGSPSSSNPLEVDYVMLRE
jgi:hypothetical protein